MATVDLTVAADLSALRKQLGDIPGLSADAATKMTAELNKSIRAAEKASLAAAKASKEAAKGAEAAGRAASNALEDAADSATRFGDRAGAVGSNAGKLAGILDTLVPGLGEFARTTADVADAGEVAATSAKGFGLSLTSVLGVLGPVAVALAATGAALAYANAELEEAEERNKQLADRASAAQAATEQWNKAQAEANDRFAEATDQTAKLANQIRRSNEATDEAAAATRALLVAEVQLQETKNKGFAFSSQELVAARDRLKAFDAQVETTKTLNELVITGEYEKARAIKAEADAASQAAKFAAERAKQEAAAAEALAKATQQRKEYTSILGTLQGVTQDATDAELTGSAAVEAALQRRIDALNAETAQRVEDGNLTAEQIVSIEQARADAVVALEAEAQGKIDQLNEEALQKRLAEIEQEQAAREESARAAVSATAGLFGSIGDLAGAAGEAQVGASEEAALALFEIQKAAALAQAAINTALAVSQALVAGAGTPVGAILAASALASGVAQAATIASTPPPSFSDTPGVMQMGNRGAVSLAAGDYFASAKDPQELQRQTGGGGSASILEVRLGHRVLDRSVAQVLRQGGRLSREINSTRTGSPSHAVRS